MQKRSGLLCFRVPPGILLILFVLCASFATGQQSSPPANPPTGMIYLDVVVTPKSGPPVSGLQEQDFTVLDNKARVPINSFQAFGGDKAPIELVLVVDDVNTGIEHVAYERSEIDKFLRANGGKLAYPTSLAVLTDSGLKVQDVFSTDGNALRAALDNNEVGLHSILRSGGIYAAQERFEASIQALLQLANRGAARPGRKFMVWISPGWPLLSGPGVEEQMDNKQRQGIYNNVVGLSNLLRQGRITLYSIDPLGSADFAGRGFYWRGFSKGISKPSEADWGDIALQVIATQSGGMALTTGNDVTAELQKCLADAQAYYEISFAAPLDTKHGEYHRVEVQVAKGGVTARTRQGYYFRP